MPGDVLPARLAVREGKKELFLVVFALRLNSGKSRLEIK